MYPLTGGSPAEATKSVGEQRPATQEISAIRRISSRTHSLPCAFLKRRSSGALNRQSLRAVQSLLPLRTTKKLDARCESGQSARRLGALSGGVAGSTRAFKSGKVETLVAPRKQDFRANKVQDFRGDYDHSPPTDLTALAKRSEGGKYRGDRVATILKNGTELTAYGSSDMPIGGGRCSGLRTRRMTSPCSSESET